MTYTVNNKGFFAGFSEGFLFVHRREPFWGFIVNPYSWVLQKTLAKGFPVGSKEPLRVFN